METLWDHVRHLDDQSPLTGARGTAFCAPSCSAPYRPRLLGSAPLFPAGSPRLRTASSALLASRALPGEEQGRRGRQEPSVNLRRKERGQRAGPEPPEPGLPATPQRKREVKAPGCGFLSVWAC